MEFLTSILGVASGGVFGLVGTLVGAWSKYKERQQQAEERDRERGHELALIGLQMEQGDRETENELAIVRATTDANMRTGSYQMPITTQGVPDWVNAARSLFRPFLTLLLNVAQCVVVLYLINALGDEAATINIVMEGESVAADLLRYSVHSLMFAANTATVWWFGDRALTPPGAKQR